MKKKLSVILSVVMVVVFAFMAIASSSDVKVPTDEGMSVEINIPTGFDGTIVNNYGEEEETTQNVNDPILNYIEYQNALKSAKSYIEYSDFSRTGLIDQLEYEKYSYEASVYAADHVGADWEEEALESALSYLEYSAFSKEGLIGQLEYEKFTDSEVKYAIDNCDADWFEQAAKSAKSYLEYSSFSREGLIDQLEFEGFTYEQAVYGAEQNGY